MRESGIFIVCVFFLLGCQKDFDIKNLNNNQISVIGHGGMGISNLYPINTAESFLKCMETGADGIEIDVQMTKDSVLVAYHNKFLEENTDLAGLIHANNWENLKLGRYITSSSVTYNLLNLNDVFNLFKDKSEATFVLDCKKNSSSVLSYQDYRATYIRAIEQVISKNNVEGQVIIESQDTVFLRRVKEKMPTAKLMFYPASFEEGYNVAKNMQLYGITISNSKISKEQVLKAHIANLRVAVWNVNTRKKNRDAIQKNPDYIQTDRLIHLVNLLD